jgi:hypothetical protein
LTLFDRGGDSLRAGGSAAKGALPNEQTIIFVVDILLAGERRSKGLKTMEKIRVPALLSMVALTFCALPLISLAPVGRAGATDDPSPVTNAIADAEGALRVPADYRSIYEYLGSWAVAADPGPGSKQLH